MPFVAFSEVGPRGTTPRLSQPSREMHYAYILRSVPEPDRYYYGSTSDLRKRLKTHNAGGNVSTRQHRPWALVWYGGFTCEETAMDFERYLKTASGKAFARKRLIPDHIL